MKKELSHSEIITRSEKLYDDLIGGMSNLPPWGKRLVVKNILTLLLAMIDNAYGDDK